MPVIDKQQLNSLKENESKLNKVTLDIYDDFTNEEIQVLSNNTSIKELVLKFWSRSKSPTQAKRLVTLLENNPRIISLSLYEQECFDQFRPEDWNLVLRTLLNSKSIHCLSLNLVDASAESIGMILSKNTSLIEFKVSGASWKDTEIVANGLKSNKTLRSLSVSCKRNLTFVVNSITTALGENTALKTLDLSRNQQTVGFGETVFSESINVDGAQKIAAMLGTNKTLVKLSLDYHYDIGDAGAKALAEGLRKNSCLKELSLVRCDISSAGAIDLAAVLNSNKSLGTLNLAKNKIGSKGTKALNELLSKNQVIFDLNLQENQPGFFSKIGNESLIQAINGKLKNRERSNKTLDTRLEYKQTISNQAMVSAFVAPASEIKDSGPLYANNDYTAMDNKDSPLQIKDKSDESKREKFDFKNLKLFIETLLVSPKSAKEIQNEMANNKLLQNYNVLTSDLLEMELQKKPVQYPEGFKECQDCLQKLLDKLHKLEPNHCHYLRYQ